MIREAKKSDLKRVMELYEAGKSFMRANGNDCQWINGYPQESLVLEDIKNHCLFVMEDGNSIYGVFSFITGNDPTYNTIDGKWINTEPYGTIHRICGDGSKKDVLNDCVLWAEKRIRNLRIDTHEKNIPMQNAIKKAGFEYCGIIHISDGSPRLAYQKICTI